MARLTIIGVVAFLLIDAVLIGVALSRGGNVGGGVPGPIPTFSDETTTPGPTPSPTPVSEPVSEPISEPVIPSPRFLVATSDGQAWRASVGSCAGPATVIESTTDGGTNWLAAGPDDAGRALALAASDDSTASLVSDITPDCEIGAAITTTAGQEWESVDPVEASWIDPADSRVIQTPEGPLATPCPTVRQLVVRGDAALILCDGALFERVAATGAWVTLPAPGALAVTSTDAGYSVASTGVTGCAGVSILFVAAPVGSAVAARSDASRTRPHRPASRSRPRGLRCGSGRATACWSPTTAVPHGDGSLA